MFIKAISLTALAVSLVGCMSSTTADYQQKKAAEVTTGVVKRQDLTGYSFFDGNLVIPASAQATAYSPYDTPVVSVMTGVGKHVERGEPIVKLTIPGADSAAAMAKADATSAKANYSAEKATQSAPVKEAQRVLSEARAAEKLARDTVASGGTADVEAATQARVDAEAALAQAQQQMRRSLQPTKDAVVETSASLSLAKDDARKGLIRAPISGTVVTLAAQPGMMAQSKQAMATIIDYDAVRVQGILPAELKDLVKKDSRVLIAMNGSSADPLDGRVLEVSVVPPSQGQTSAGYLAVIRFQDPQLLVQPITSVKRIGIKTGTAHAVLVVPVTAITMKDGKATVGVQSGDKWIETPVQTGISDGALIEIKSGLTEGSIIRLVK